MFILSSPKLRSLLWQLKDVSVGWGGVGGTLIQLCMQGLREAKETTRPQRTRVPERGYLWVLFKQKLRSLTVLGSYPATSKVCELTLVLPSTLAFENSLICKTRKKIPTSCGHWEN